uniref:Uncharacterized protein n=1 Tax=Arundo donax TaxID=35708 RepID=A0A0A9G8G5_ARUDO
MEACLHWDVAEVVLVWVGEEGCFQQVDMEACLHWGAAHVAWEL